MGDAVKPAVSQIGDFVNKKRKNTKKPKPSMIVVDRLSQTEEPSFKSFGEEELSTSKLQLQQLQRNYSRTSLLLLDYLQFKSARKIQTLVRGWLVRRIMARRHCAATIIQREWRRYYAQRNYYRILENRVQQRIDEYHYKAATKIQAYWRGFWVRENIHDQYRLKRSQRMAAEDLLHCIAYKLHYLLRTYQIPGIYSLRNSNALSKVEKLLISISYKQGNRRAFVSRLKREADLEQPKEYFKKSAHATRLPYAGPNFSGLCDPKCCEIFKEPDIDARMHQVLRIYESDQYKQRQKCRPKAKKSKIKIPKDPEDFCNDVIGSMRRWNILAPNKFDVKPDVFKNPENVAEFLTEIESLYDFMQGNCSCKVDPKNFTPTCAKK